MNQDQIPAVIPSYEPDERLLDLLARLSSCGIKKVVLVDDGSGEEYGKYFKAAEEKYGASVLHHKKNLGKGAALKTAFLYCIENVPDLIGCVTADSDGQHSPGCILKCMTALDQAPEKLVMGCRDFSLPGIPKASIFGNKCTNKIMKNLYGRELRDTQTGLRGLPKKFMESCLSIKGERFEFEIKMLAQAFENKVDILEVPIQTIYDSEKNHSTHFRPFVDTVKIYSALGFFRSIGIILFKK